MDLVDVDDLDHDLSRCVTRFRRGEGALSFLARGEETTAGVRQQLLLLLFFLYVSNL